MSWLSHQIHAAEAAGIRYVADAIIAPHEAELNALAGDAPAAADQLVALVEQAAGKLGPIAAGAVNAVLSAVKPQIEAEVAALAGQGAAVGIPMLVQALHNVADRLAAE